MSEYVMETECTKCVHRQVCSFKEDYLKALEKLHDCDCYEHFNVKLNCKYFTRLESTKVATPTLTGVRYNGDDYAAVMTNY